MKATDLIEHLSRSLGRPYAEITNSIRAARRAGVITLAGKGGAAAEMTEFDKIAGLIAANCGSTNQIVTEDVKLWLAHDLSDKEMRNTVMKYAGPDLKVTERPYKFLREDTFYDSLRELLKADVHEIEKENQGNKRAFATVDFHVDETFAVLTLTRVDVNEYKRGGTAQTYRAEYASEIVAETRKKYPRAAALIRRIEHNGILAFSTCLADERK